MIVLMAGLPGTGKSTLARELAAQTSGRVLSKDEIRHAIFLPERNRILLGARRFLHAHHARNGRISLLPQARAAGFFWMAVRFRDDIKSKM